jgi:hypothetical protein
LPSLACVAADFNQWTGSAFLVAFQRHAAAQAYFEPIERHLDLRMKRVRYSPLQKVQTLVASIVIGCPHTKAINHELVPDRVAAREWGMDRFPDQSQINVLLNRMTEENVGQLGQAHHDLLLAHSQLRSAPVVVVDLDQTGLTVTGKRFELASKGYFPRRRGSRGYQLSTALASAEGREPEAVASYLDPGNVNEGKRLHDLLRATLAAFEQRGQALRFRLDAGYGNYATLEALQAAEVGFVVKWKDNRTPRKFAAQLALNWEPHTDKVRVAEGPEFAGCRSVICEVAEELTMLLTNLDLTPRALFDYYNQRQTIEAFFKADKHVFGMANLRSRRFLSIAAFLRLVMTTHNLLVWTKAVLFAGSRLAGARTRELVEQVARIPALVVRHGASIHLHMPDIGTLARHLREALCPTAAQLPLPYLRL